MFRAYRSGMLGSDLLLRGETQGMAIDFSYPATTGSVTIRDTATPANDLNNSSATSWLTQSGTSPKLVRAVDGTYGWSGHNLLVQSGDSETTWTAQDITITSGQVDPDGGSTAFLFTHDDSTSAFFQAITMAVGARARHTVYWKAGTQGDFLRIANGTVSVWFDVTSGTPVVGATDSGYIGSTVTALSGGWFQIDVDFTVQGAPANFGLWMAVGDGSSTEAGGDNFYTWRFHLRYHTGAADTYIPTTTAAVYLPALHVHPTHGRGLLVEPAATNPLTQTRDLTSGWTETNITSAATATGIDGVANAATTLTADAANATTRQDVTSASAARIQSIFAKRRTGTGAVYISQGETTGVELVTNGTFTTDTTGWTANNAVISVDTARLKVDDTAAAGSWSAAVQQITMITGKWYRLTCDVVSTTTAASIGLHEAATTNNANVTLLNAGSAGAKVIYFQFNGTDDYLLLDSDGAGVTLYDNVSIEEVVETEMTLTTDYQRFSTASATITNPPIIIRMATSGDAFDVDVVQQETGSVVTSPIPTAGAAVTRAADDVSEENAVFPVGAAMSALITYVPLAAYTGTLLSIGDAADQMAVLDDGAGSVRVTETLASGANNLDLAAISVAETKVAMRFADDDLAASMNGAAVVADTTTNSPGTPDAKVFFSALGTPSVTQPILIKDVTIVTSAWTDAELQAKTS
jgi:hypothetical protein